MSVMSQICQEMDEMLLSGCTITQVCERFGFSEADVTAYSIELNYLADSATTDDYEYEDEYEDASF